MPPKGHDKTVRRSVPGLSSLPRPVYGRTESLPNRALTRRHSHPWVQLSYAISGVLEIQTSVGRFVAPPQRAVWIPAGVPHRVFSSPHTEMRSLYLDCSVTAWAPERCQVLEVSSLLRELIGTLIGLVSAYAGGWVDALLMRLVDLLLSFPGILMALMILAWLGKGVGNVVLTLVVLEWAYYARTARGQALVESRREYVEAARGQGISRWRILVGHILPNCLPPLIVIGALQIARAITLEATLSFLGLGVPITEPSLGLLIANGFQFMLGDEYWISVFPGLALLLTIVAINLVGDRLRDVLNPRLQR